MGATPDAAPVAANAPRAGVIIVSSKPDGATVFKGDQKLGETPLPLDLAVGEEVTLTVRRAGFEDGTQIVTGTANQQKVKVALKKEKRVPGGGKTPGTTTPGTTTPGTTTPGTTTPGTKLPGELKGMPGDDSEDLQ